MSTFPVLIGRTLEGQEMRIPEDLPVGPRLLVLAFRRWQTQWIRTWEEPLQAVAAHCPALSIWEIPALSLGYLPARRFIDAGMRAGIPDASARAHTLTVYTNLRKLADALELPSLQTIYLLLLDAYGAEVWRGQGAADDAQVRAMTLALDGLSCST